MVDLVNKTFGSWVVLTRVKGGWFCRCKCGNEKVIRTGNLKKSNRCMVCSRVDYTGKQFGDWKVIGRDISKKQYWVCGCKCGKIKSVHASNLMNGVKKCKDCWKKEVATENLSDKQFGDWVVLYRNVENRKQWICQCKCGVKKLVYGRSLIIGDSTCCLKCSAAKRQAGVMNRLPSKVLSRIKFMAKKRNIFLDLGQEENKFLYELLQKQNYICALSGLPIKVSNTNWGHGHSETTASLDRIDSTKGYTRDNVQWVHKWINWMKLDLDQEEFITLCEAVVRHKRMV